MKTFTSELQETYNIPATNPILTPGRTDRKIIRGEDPSPDSTYRSKVGSLMWTTMGIRYDITYASRNSRVFSKNLPKSLAKSYKEHCNTSHKQRTPFSSSTTTVCVTTEYPQPERNLFSHPTSTILMPTPTMIPSHIMTTLHHLKNARTMGHS
jgi:hypothetical protein